MNTGKRVLNASRGSLTMLTVLVMISLPLAAWAQNLTQPPKAVSSSATYFVIFRGAGPTQPANADELYNLFKRGLPDWVRTHHYRTASVEGVLTGYLCVDGAANRDAVEKRFKDNRDLVLVQLTEATAEQIAQLDAMAPPAASSANAAPPRIVSTSPQVGALDVDPAISEIAVTFDKDMGGGMSWTGGGPDFPPVPEGQKIHWNDDKRTCVMPVKLEAGHYYRVGINSTSYQNFRSVGGIPTQPSAIFFVTRGADEATRQKAMKPVVVEMVPPNGATGVDPNLKELRVTFSVPMGGSFSWTGGGPNYPSGPEGSRPQWSEDKKTCTRPVVLKPNTQYQLGLNSPSHKNFQSETGIPLDWVRWTFTTGPGN